MPEHKVAFGLTLITGLGFTVTTTTLVLVQLPVVPVTVYEVVTLGLAVGLGQFVQLKPVAGTQLYVVAPLAVKGTLFPLHMLGLAGLTFTVGVGFTVIVTIAVALQVPVVPVIV